ncbi:MAG: thioesterase domain-containing protein [Prolixibacteraceae bacterium]|jgi:surfactin synthase thioesterase subunit|nr:thioesterase domain-containing protein [Prolixibacteraceae bacterium]
MKLFFIPFSGGNAYSYSEFEKYLPEEIEFINLELPGRGKRIAEDLLTNIDDMTEDLFGIIEPEIKGNYALFGHSLGALLCFTLCRYIAMKKANPPKYLFVSGQTAPCLIKPDKRYSLPDDKFIEMLRQMEGTPEELLSDQGFVQFFLPIVKMDFQAIANYKHVPTKPFNVPIAVLLGNLENISNEDAANWQIETNEEITIHRFDGGHFFIFNKTEEICRLISDKIF